MKTFRASTGPFTEQPFFELAEIERICAEELRKVGLYPAEPGPVRIDRFIEKRFKILPTYDDLPTGLLGFTKFGASGVEEIVVSRALDSEGTTTAERRVRTTLAHEGGHGLLHAYLFAIAARPEALFGDGLAPDAPKILCRDDAPTEPKPAPRSQKKPRYRWWEYQANQAMSSLLLPKALVQKAVASSMVPQGRLGLLSLPAERRDSSVLLLADLFDVNPVVARIRLDAIFPAAVAGQLTL